MQENEDIFKYEVSSNYYEGNIMKSEKGTMIRKGIVGDGKDKLDTEQENKWQAMNDQYFGDKPGLSEWLLNGGPFPPPTEAEVKAGGPTTPLLSKS